MSNGNAYLGDFAQGSAFFSKIDHNSTPSPLSFLYGLFDSKNEVWTAGADVRSKHIRSVTLIVDTKCQFDIGIRHLCRITEAINSQPSNRGKEQLDVTTSDEFGV